MKCIIDANVVLPLLCEGHPFQKAAWSWFETKDSGTVGWCLPVRLATLRHLSNNFIMGSNPLRPEEALDAWGRLARDERLFEVATPPAELEAYLRANVSGREPTTKLWGDAWLAALAESLGYEMVTCDRGFANFQLRFLHLIQP